MAKAPNRPSAQPLSETEIDILDTFLSERTGPIRSLEGLDGMVCALTCAPTPVDCDQYLGAVLGADSYIDDAQAQSIKNLAKRHQEIVQSGLHDSLESETLYTPALLVDEDGKAQGNQWALGFLLGVSMTEGDWKDFTQGDEMARLLLPMMVLAHEHHPDPQMRPSPIPPESRDEVLYMMANSLALIYGHFNGKSVSG